MEMDGKLASKDATSKSCSIEKACSLPSLVWKKIWKLGREDPRRVIHGLKVGVCLALVSLLYLLESLFEGIGQNAIWAVMTVVVVLEFTAGATLCKGLNRGFGTLCAGLLAYSIECIADLDESRPVFRAVFIGISVFIIGFAATYMRFFPNIKKNYDYGILIFLLTFNLVTVSSYRIQDVFTIANQRFYTIAMGCGMCLFMSLLVFPNWSGEDLHNSTVCKLEGLAKSIEACVNEYFEEHETVNQEKLSDDEDPIYKGYKAVLDSKSTDETLALHASWEPRHSIYCYRYPWQQYVKLGAALRHFGYTAVALHGCLQSEIQTPGMVRALFKVPCFRVSQEVSKAFMELADSVRNHRRFNTGLLSEHLQEALQDLNNAIKSQPRLFLSSSTKNNASNFQAIAAAAAAANQKQDSAGAYLSSVKTDSSALHEWRTKRVADLHKESERKVLRPTLSKLSITSLEFSEALPFAAFASLLVEMVARLELVIDEVEELGRKANFKHEDIEIVVEDQERTRRETTRDIHLPSDYAD